MPYNSTQVDRICCHCGDTFKGARNRMLCDECRENRDDRWVGNHKLYAGQWPDMDKKAFAR